MIPELRIKYVQIYHPRQSSFVWHLYPIFMQYQVYLEKNTYKKFVAVCRNRMQSIPLHNNALLYRIIPALTNSPTK
jgi:hypothetical protein